ncbi:hypothetical protein LTR16_008293 [Cryomyces antarcticus]|uniref:Uncharacterized protein n=1 Tax=Cryomyces antarcticus TaxID=329879 RepID=A0ABR0LKH7_9PEZI|nr:hypothetical protein LTR16_008293 [Cryomyces antarcticus]
MTLWRLGVSITDEVSKHSIYALDIVQLYALPPTSPSRLPPEEQQLLRHTDGVRCEVVAFDVGPQPGQRDATDDGFVRLACSVAPTVVMVEAAAE